MCGLFMQKIKSRTTLWLKLQTAVHLNIIVTTLPIVSSLLHHHQVYCNLSSSVTKPENCKKYQYLEIKWVCWNQFTSVVLVLPKGFAKKRPTNFSQAIILCRAKHSNHIPLFLPARQLAGMTFKFIPCACFEWGIFLEMVEFPGNVLLPPKIYPP